MKRLVRIVSAVGAGASLAWGIAKALRKGARRTGDTGTWQPPAAPATPPASKPAPVSEPEAVAAPEPVEVEADEAPEVEEPRDVVIKGVVIYQPGALLTFVNEADAEALKDAGVKGRALSVIEGARPFASVEDLGKTAGVGRRTLQALCAAADA